MQIAKQFDEVTVGKIKRSGLVASAGFILAVIPVLLNDPNVVHFLQAHPVAGVFAGSFAPFIINSIRQWLAGQEVPEEPKM